MPDRLLTKKRSAALHLQKIVPLCYTSKNPCGWQILSQQLSSIIQNCECNERFWLPKSAKLLKIVANWWPPCYPRGPRRKPSQRLHAVFSQGSPTQTNAVFVVGRAEAGVAFMAPSAIRCDRLAEREGECKSINNFWHLQLFGQKNALQNADCLYPLIAMQLRGFGGQHLGCWKNFSFFCQKICIYPTLYQSNNYGALLMPRFAPIAPDRPIYRTLEFLSSFWEFVERFFASSLANFLSNPASAYQECQAEIPAKQKK